MTVQLSSLRVTADLDVSGYVAGAQQKVAADNAMVASSRAVDAAVTNTPTKISQFGDSISRLERQYVDGLASSQKFQSALSTLGRAMDTGNVSSERAAPILDGLYKKYGQTADATSFTAKGQIALGAAIAAANERFAQAKPVVDAHSNALGIGNAQAMALTHSARSFVEQLALGIPVTQAAVSELSHLSFAMAGEDGVLAAAKKAGPGMIAAFAETVGTVGLVATGFGVVALAAGAYYLATREQAKDINDILTEQKNIIESLGPAYADLAKQRDENPNLYESADVGRLLLQKNLADARQTAQEQARSALRDMHGSGGMFLSLISSLPESAQSALGRSQPSIEFDRIVDAASKGEMSINEARTALQRFGEEHPDFSYTIGRFLEMSNEAAKSERAVGGLVGILDRFAEIRLPEAGRLPSLAGIEGDALGAQNRMRAQQKVALDNLGASSPDEKAAAARAQASLTYGAETPETRKMRIDNAGDLARAQAMHALTEAQDQFNEGMDRTLATQRLEISLVGQTSAAAAALKMEYDLTTKAKEEAAKNGIEVDQAEIARIHAKATEYGQLVAQQQLLQASHQQQDDLELAKLELSLVGENTLARNRAIEAMKTEQLIRRSGYPIYSQEAENLRKSTAALSDNADAMAHATMQADLLFERQQLLRNAEDQQIAAAQHSAGLPVDLNSTEAQMMRYNKALSESKDIYKSLFTDTLADLRQGKTLWESLGDAGVKALTKIADKLIDRGLDSTFSSIFGGGQGGSSPGLLGELFNFGNGGGASGNSGQQQPGVGAITSALQGQMVGTMAVQAATVSISFSCEDQPS